MTDNFGLNSFASVHKALPALRLQATTGQTADLIQFVDVDGVALASPYTKAADVATALAAYTTTVDLTTLLSAKLATASFNGLFDTRFGTAFGSAISVYTTTADLNTALGLKVSTSAFNGLFDTRFGTAFGAHVSAHVPVIADPASATAEDVANKVNDLIGALVTAGLMAA